MNVAITATEFLWEHVDGRFPDAQQLARDAVRQMSLEEAVTLIGELKAHAQSPLPSFAPFEADRAWVSKWLHEVASHMGYRLHKAGKTLAAGLDSEQRRNMPVYSTAITAGKGVIRLSAHLPPDEPPWNTSISFCGHDRGGLAVWSDGKGSVYMMLALLGDDPDEAAFKAQNIDDLVADPPTEDRLILEGIKPFLTLFENGYYDIGIVRNDEHVEFSMPDAGTRIGGCYEGHFDGLYATQSRETIDLDRVAEWNSRIYGGARPFAIVTSLSNGWGGGRAHSLGYDPGASFVIDGHHKLLAYQERGVAPSYIWIRRVAMPGDKAEPEYALIQAFRRDVEHKLRLNTDL